MVVKINKTSAAEADIAEAINYLLANNPDAASRFVSELKSLTRRLRQFPELYPFQRRSSKPEWRQVRMAVLPHFGLLVFYTYEENIVVIRRVIHGARNEP